MPDTQPANSDGAPVPVEQAKTRRKPKINPVLLGIRKTPPKPVMPLNGLSIVEQFFFKSPPERPQVIIGGCMRLRLPPAVTHFSIPRVVALLKKSAAHHHRLSCYIDPATATTHPLAHTADKLPLNIAVAARTTHRKLTRLLRAALNTNFDTSNTSRPLWRCVLLVPESALKEFEHLPQSPDFTIVRDDIPEDKLPDPEAPEPFVDTPEGGIFFEAVFAFHHCLGDGLCLYTFSKTIFSEMIAENFLAEKLDISTFPVNTEPPPVMDNLLEPAFWQVAPSAVSFLAGYAKGFSKNRFKQIRKAINMEEEAFETEKDGDAAVEASAASSSSAAVTAAGNTTLTVPAPDALSTSNSSAALLPEPNPLSQTSARLLTYPSSLITALRETCRANGTSITSLLLIASLASTLTALSSHSAPPKTQGYVLTTSFRHLIPGSELIYGGDKQSDPSMAVFGGYAGAAMKSSLKMLDSSDLFERARSVKGATAAAFKDSLGRAMLVNYVYRRKWLWNMIQKYSSGLRGKVERSFSIELANLGVWKYHTASPTAPPEDNRVRLYAFWGAANSSFDGARGFFNVGSVTLGGDMSLAVSYDVGVVGEDKAKVFVETLDGILKKVAARDGAKGKMSIAEARGVQANGDSSRPKEGRKEKSK
ncbi:hypothetical protein BJ742DRAFT_788323 [Cladochytrium replicatum]|nr:hypothetical protein BJ742DRAFT_788323 [Cladochytrium replicatum]